MSEHKSNIESENDRFEEAEAHDVKKNENFAVEDVRKDENFVENAVLSDARHDASSEHTQSDISIETVSALSRTPEIILRPMDVRRRGNHCRNDDIISSGDGVGSTRGGGNEEEDGDYKKKRNSERRKIFNMVKYIIANCLDYLRLDLWLDSIFRNE